MAAKPTLEKVIQREICEWLDRQQLMFWRSNNVPVFSASGRNNQGEMRFRALPKFTPRGLPDVQMIIDGKFVGLEIKRPGRTLSPDQEKFGMRVLQAGGDYHCVHSLDEVMELMDKVYSI